MKKYYNLYKNYLTLFYFVLKKYCVEKIAYAITCGMIILVVEYCLIAHLIKTTILDFGRF